MKSIFFMSIFSFSLLFAQEYKPEEAQTLAKHELYQQALDQQAAETAQKHIQSQELITNVNYVLLGGKVQQMNVKLALSFYSDFAKPCVVPDKNNPMELKPFILEEVKEEEYYTLHISE